VIDNILNSLHVFLEGEYDLICDNVV